jgi:hypothetical protein
MRDFAPTETHPVFPLFLLLDVSGSMSGEPIEALNEALPGLKEAIRQDPTVGEIARIGVITFSDEARTVLPLCDLLYAEMPSLSCEGGRISSRRSGWRAGRSRPASGPRGRAPVSTLRSCSS